MITRHRRIRAAPRNCPCKSGTDCLFLQPERTGNARSSSIFVEITACKKPWRVVLPGLSNRKTTHSIAENVFEEIQVKGAPATVNRNRHPPRRCSGSLMQSARRLQDAHSKRGKVMTYETIQLERSAPVWLLTLNRPHRLNAMSQTMLDEIAQACNEIEADPACRVVVVRGAGAAFTAGFDLQDQAANTPHGRDA